MTVHAGDLIGSEPLAESNYDGVGEVHRQVGVFLD